MIVATLATLSNSDQTPELAHDSEAIDEEARRRINNLCNGLKGLEAISVQLDGSCNGGGR